MKREFEDYYGDKLLISDDDEEEGVKFLVNRDDLHILLWFDNYTIENIRNELSNYLTEQIGTDEEKR